MEIVSQLILNSIIAGAIYAVITLGFNLLFGTVKFFDLGYGGLAVIGAYTAFALIRFAGWSVWPAALLGLAAGAIAGWLTYKLIYSPLRARRASSLVMIVASLGVFTVIQALAAIFFSSQFQTLWRLGVAGAYEILGGVITKIQVLILVVGLIIYLLLWLVFKYTDLGKSIRAIADDEEAAKIVGVNTNRLIGLVFLAAGAIAAAAGILVGLDTGIEPTMGLPLLLKGVIAAIVGGVGNPAGGLLGAFLLGAVENFGVWFTAGEWKDAIAFALLIVFLLFRPSGLLKR